MWPLGGAPVVGAHLNAVRLLHTPSSCSTAESEADRLFFFVFPLYTPQFSLKTIKNPNLHIYMLPPGYRRELPHDIYPLVGGGEMEHAVTPHVCCPSLSAHPHPAVIMKELLPLHRETAGSGFITIYLLMLNICRGTVPLFHWNQPPPFVEHVWGCLTTVPPVCVNCSNYLSPVQRGTREKVVCSLEFFFGFWLFLLTRSFIVYSAISSIWPCLLLLCLWSLVSV